MKRGEVHKKFMLCIDAGARSLIGKPKFVGYEAMMNLLDVMPCECEAHT